MTKGTILFLAYHFPPNITSVAGVRGGNLALELAKNGWQVKVITPMEEVLAKTDPIGQPVPKHDNLEIIGTKHDWPELAHWWIKERPGIFYKIAGKLGRGFFQLFNLDQSYGWCRHVMAAAKRFKPGGISAVLATGSPYISFKLAARVAKKLKCPYVMDYRDPWTSDPGNEVWNPLIKKREDRLLRGASAVVAVSPTWAGELCNHGLARPAIAITNGYNPEQLGQIKPAVFAEPAISYTGRFMPPLTSPEALMKILRALDALNPDLPWKFHYYGLSHQLVDEAVKKFELSRRVVNHGMVSRQECLEATKGSVAAIAVSSDNEHARGQECGIIRAKLFEMMGLGCPIVYIAPPELDVCRLVKNTGSGQSFAATEVEGVAEYLFSLITAKPAISADCRSCSWPVLGKKYSDLLEEITHK